jgi:hypothetical protein
VGACLPGEACSDMVTVSVSVMVCVMPVGLLGDTTGGSVTVVFSQTMSP